MKKINKLIKLNSNEYLFGLSCFFYGMYHL